MYKSQNDFNKMKTDRAKEWESDLKPFTHGSEGTHYACNEAMREKHGIAVKCCGCSGHKCHTPEQSWEQELEEVLLNTHFAGHIKDKGAFIIPARNKIKDIISQNFISKKELMGMLPEKKDISADSLHNVFAQGYNEALDDLIDKLGL